MLMNVLFLRNEANDMQEYDCYRRGRTFSAAKDFLKGFLLAILNFTFVIADTEKCQAQQLVLYPPGGKPSVAFYTGDARWLVEQSDPRSHLHEIPSLRKLVLQNHNVSAEEIEYIARLQQLEELELGGSPEGIDIEPAAFRSLDKLANITSLGICKSNLQDADMEIVSRLPRVMSLAVEKKFGEPASDQVLTEKFVTHILKLKDLEYLSVRLEAPWTDELFAKALSLPKIKHIEVCSRLLTDRSLREIASKGGDTQVVISSPQFTAHQISSIARRKGTSVVTVNGVIISIEE